MIRTLGTWIVFPLASLLLLLGACEREEPQPPAATEERAAQPQEQKAEGEMTASEAMQKAEEEIGRQAVAVLKPTEGNQTSGKVTFTSQEDGVLIVADVEGLEPGKHGFHIHEKGDCSAPDASSVGGHYNPEGTPHGAPDDPPDQRHVGDLGNIEAGPDGSATYQRVDQVISLSGEQGIIGKAVIIHAKPDDLETQPTGGAGPRLACGVIEEGGPQSMSDSSPQGGQEQK